MENSQPIHIAKKKKVCSGENTKIEAGKLFAERLGVEFMNLNNHLSRARNRNAVTQERSVDYFLV